MKLCYLINQYPKVSHSFIRREILELECQGAAVLRVALRGWDQQLADPEDEEERQRTRYVLGRGLLPVLLAATGELLRRPVAFCRAALRALALSRGSDTPLLKHLVCLAEACTVARWVRAAGARHVHAHFGTNSAEVALLAAQLAQVPFSFTVHGPEEFDHPEGLRLGEKLRHASKVVAISSYGRSQLYRWAPVSHWHKVAVVHCGLDAAFLAEPPRSAFVRRFVCVGRLSPQKGQLLLLEALRRLLDAGHECQVVLAGDGEMRTEIEVRARQLRLEQHLSITGWVDSTRVRDELLSARALVLPSFAEGLPVVLMEAMAMARPVITTQVAGIPELVLDGECGWLVPAGDVDALAAAMADCLQQQDEQLLRMGRNGRARVIERHDIRNEAAKLRALFAGGVE